MPGLSNTTPEETPKAPPDAGRTRLQRLRPRLRPGTEIGHRPRAGKHADAGHDLDVPRGLAALSLDALSSVAYGPEAIMLVLIAAGSSALRFTLPIVLVITGMLVLLVISYSQVIAAHPDGGGAYAVSKANLGRWPAMVAAASLVVDYVLTVAVSLAAGAASLGSVFPGLAHHLLLVAAVGLVLLTAVNMFGIAESAKALMLPAAVFLLSIFAVIVIGIVEPHVKAVVGRSLVPFKATEALGIILILKAFAAGCSAVTGIEAIANGVPAFREPRSRTAQRTEITLGVLLGLMLVGLAVLVHIHHVQPRGGVTVLAQITAGSLGTGWPFYVSNIAVTIVLGLAANTSFGGLPVLLSPAGPRPPAAPRLLSARRAPGLPDRHPGAGGRGTAVADCGQRHHQRADPAVCDRGVPGLHPQPDRPGAPLAPGAFQPLAAAWWPSTGPGR